MMKAGTIIKLAPGETFASFVPPTVGETLQRHFMGPHNITQTKLAAAMKVSRTTIFNIIVGITRLSPRLALRLADALGTTPEFWLDLQQPADVRAARASKHATVKADRIFDGSGIEKAFRMTVGYIETPLDKEAIRELFGAKEAQ